MIEFVSAWRETITVTILGAVLFVMSLVLFGPLA